MSSMVDVPYGVDDDEWTTLLMHACDIAEERHEKRKAEDAELDLTGVMNFKVRKCKRKVFSIFEDPAVAAERDAKHLEDAGITIEQFEKAKAAFIERMSNISEERARIISEMPQHLSNGDANPDWLQSRRHRITGSITGAIAGLNKYSTPDDCLESLLRPAFKGNCATRWGNEHEDDAESAFESYLSSFVVGTHHPSRDATITGYKLNTPGLCVSTTEGRGMFGMSPDVRLL